MQERHVLTEREINRDLLGFSLTTPRNFWLAAIPLGLMVALMFSAVGYMIYWGIGVTGLNRPVMWGFMITNFVFWVGISHAGVMISAILRLSHAEWRRPITRAAEVLTVFALATAALFPLIHTGRPWRAIYWVFPYDFSRGIWPAVRSPLIWDPSAIFTYLTGSSLFVFVALIPDLAVARDNSVGWRRTFYGLLSLGYRGTTRQWRLQLLAGILLSALILPVFVSVHSIVSWDFGMSLVPAWHVTIFAPYFVIGAVHSGVSAVVALMVLLRWAFHLQAYLTPDHFDAIGRLLIAVGNTWFYFFWLDFFFALLAREPDEVAVWELRLFHWPYNVLFAIFLITAYFIPVPLWLFRRVRRSIPLMLLTSISVNIGMWLERFLIIIPGLQWKQPLTFNWFGYRPSIVEIILVTGSFALVAFGVLMFSKFFPIIPLFDIKEGQKLRHDLRIGHRQVPGVIRE
ncbi:MAG: polysulfide reductase NrfD [Chloroflexi bacterium]|nr:polysulfide reductase NrfD [Chloroflexota bacterium]